MTSHRIAQWCRLVLAAAVLALPAASAAAVAPAVHSTTSHHHDKTAAIAAATTASLAPAPSLHRARHLHRTAPTTAAVATTCAALLAFLVCGLVTRRRTSQLVGVVRHWWSSRAPPSGTGSLVPFGHPSGRAGRFSRSPRALFSRSIPHHC